MQSSSLRMRNEQKDFPIAHVLLERICADFLSGNVLCQGKVNSPVADAQECDSFWYLHILDCRRFVHELCILVMNILKVECNFACSAGCSRLEEPKCTASPTLLHVESMWRNVGARKNYRCRPWQDSLPGAGTER